MNKLYDRINWENYPSDETPLNESNLNKMDAATDELDNRVITLDTTKAAKSEILTLVQDITFEEKTGIITIIKKNGSKITIDTQMEKIAVNFSYDAEKQQIILTLIDGTKQYIDLSALITQYEFLDSDTVAFSIDDTGKVSAIVKEGSIQEKHLQPDYLADIKVEAAKAQASQMAAAKSESNAKVSETAAAASESNAEVNARKAQSYATGGTNSRTGEDTDNAKYYSQQAAQSRSEAVMSADTASAKAEESANSATTAKISADNAAGSANLANEKANNAANSAASAMTGANTAQQYASNAAASADAAQNYAVADTDSAKYYYEQARRISESFSGALRPMGTVTFANLPALSEVAGGSMYNISDQFTTTAEFKEGAGNTIPAGANVYKTEDGKWDVLAGTPVTGVKGSAESAYRRGNVNITADNVGALPRTGGILTGALGFANSTWNPVGDDVAIGDHDVAGNLGVKGLNGTPGISLYNQDGSYYADVIHSANIGSQSVSHASTTDAAGTANIANEANVAGVSLRLARSGNRDYPMTFNWAGKTGQPTWLWGGENGTDMFVYNPSNFSVNYAGNAAKVNNHTVNTDVPANAKFTDTNTWRPVQDNLTSKSTTDCLSALQGYNLANGWARDNTKLPLTGGELSGTLTNRGVTKLYGLDTVGEYKAYYSTYKDPAIGIACCAKFSDAVAIGGKLYAVGNIATTTGWLNLQADNAIQARNKNDSAWVVMNALSFNQQSSARYKKNITNMSDEEALKLLKYRVVDYDYINEADGTGCQGLVAEEVAEINEYPVYRTPNGTIEGLDYSRFVPQLIKMVQIQQKEIDELRRTIESLKN